MRMEVDFLYQVLIKSKARPELLIGEKNLGILQGFLNGYLCAIKNNEQMQCEPYWFDEFIRFVNQKHNPNGRSYNIERIIYEQGYDCVSGIDYFFQMLDEFAVQQCGQGG